jgi:hypothetical protein
MRCREAFLLLLTFSVGCHNCGGGDDPIVEAETDTFGPSTTSGFFDDTTTGFASTVPVGDTGDNGGDTAAATSTTGGSADECQASAECGAELFCVAPFDQSLGPYGKGDYACVTECVMLLDEDRWCADVGACCDPDAECTDRGYCEIPGSDSGDTGGSGSSSGGDSGGSDTGGTGTTTGG